MSVERGDNMAVGNKGSGADTAIKQTKKSPQTHKASAGKSASGKVQFFFEGFLQNGGEVYICLFGFFVQP